MILRGPSIVIICSLYILLNILFQVTNKTLIAVLGLMIGFLVTIGDISHIAKFNLSSISDNIHSFVTTTVLEELIQGVIMIVFGIYSGVATIISAYTPFVSVEHRVQLVQSVLPNNIDARRVLLTPGGLWSLIIEKWVQHNNTKFNDNEIETNLVIDVTRQINDVREDDTLPPVISEYNGDQLNHEMDWEESTGDDDSVESSDAHDNGTLDEVRSALNSEINNRVIYRRYIAVLLSNWEGNSSRNSRISFQ